MLDVLIVEDLLVDERVEENLVLEDRVLLDLVLDDLILELLEEVLLEEPLLEELLLEYEAEVVDDTPESSVVDGNTESVPVKVIQEMVLRSGRVEEGLVVV